MKEPVTIKLPITLVNNPEGDEALGEVSETRGVFECLPRHITGWAFDYDEPDEELVDIYLSNAHIVPIIMKVSEFRKLYFKKLKEAGLEH